MRPPSPGRELNSFEGVGAAAQDPARREKAAAGLCPLELGGGCLPAQGWKWRVAEPHTVMGNDLSLSSTASIVPVLTWPEGSGSGSTSLEQPAKGQRKVGRALEPRKNPPWREQQPATQSPTRPLRRDPGIPAQQRNGGRGRRAEEPRVPLPSYGAQAPAPRELPRACTEAYRTPQPGAGVGRGAPDPGDQNAGYSSIRDPPRPDSSFQP